MKTDYKKLEKQIDEIILIIDDIINQSQLILENKNLPLIDRSFHFHLFNLFHFIFNGLYDVSETLEIITEKNENERIKYLLTNLPDEAINDLT